MKTSLFLMLLCTVSFLAVCRATEDDFSFYDEVVKGKGKVQNKTPPRSLPNGFMTPDEYPAPPPPPPPPPPRPSAKPNVGGKTGEKSTGSSTPTPAPKPETTPAVGTTPAVAPTAPSPVSNGTPGTAEQPAPAALTKKNVNAQIEKFQDALNKDPKNIHLIFQLADELYKNGEYEQTTSLLWKSVEKADRGSLLLLARAHEKKNEPDQMIKAMNILTSKDPKDFEAFYFLGNAYFLKNKNKETLESYKSSLEINPHYEPSYLGLVKFYEKRKNLYELRILYQDMIDNIGAKAIYLSKLCEINTNDGTFEAAMTKCREAMNKNPNDAEAHVNLGLSQKGAGDTADAEKTLKTAARKFPKSEFAQYTYARLLEDQKNYVDSFVYYKAGAAADAKSARCWLGVAISAFELQKFDISIVAYKKACTLDHKNSVYFRKAATQIKSTKNFEWARKYEDAAEQCSFGN